MPKLPTLDRGPRRLRARRLALLVPLGVLALAAVGAILPDDRPPVLAEPLPLPGPAELDTLALLRGSTVGPDGKLWATVPDGRTVTFTIDPGLQRRLEKLLAERPVPYGVSVAVEPSTGRILALAEHSRAEPDRAFGLAALPISPAASVFKVVTSAALLARGVPADETVCYHGGKHRLRPKLLEDSPRDHRCVTLALALGHSTNVAFAKLADRYLDPDLLRSTARQLLFNAPLSVDGSPLEPSPAVVPDDPFAFATTAAGFNFDVRLTPLHGALLAAAVANGGLAMPLTLIDSLGGEPVAPRPGRQLLAPEVAAELGDMLKLTVTEGTASRAFRNRRLPAFEAGAAGKTGSLHEKEPFRDHTWFVGYAPADEPEVAIATVIVNETIWHVRAPYVARESLRRALDAVEGLQRRAGQLAERPGPGSGSGQGNAAPL